MVVRNAGTLGLVIAGGVVAQVGDLLTRVPRPPGELGEAGAEEAEIADLARRVGRVLPGALVDWLRVCWGRCDWPWRRFRRGRSATTAQPGVLEASYVVGTVPHVAMIETTLPFRIPCSRSSVGSPSMEGG
jgi:hypothetical protein